MGPRTIGSLFSLRRCPHRLTSPELGTTHNFVLQTILDLRYIGLVVMIWLLVLALSNLLRAITVANPSPAALCLAAMLLYFTAIGVTEGAPSIYYEDSLFAWLLVVAVALRRDLPTRSNPPIHQRYSGPYEASARVGHQPSGVGAAPERALAGDRPRLTADCER